MAQTTKTFYPTTGGVRWGTSTPTVINSSDFVVTTTGSKSNGDFLQVQSGVWVPATPWKNSIERDSNDLQLVGDESSPGTNKYYGTATAASKGWFDLPESGDGVWEELAEETLATGGSTIDFTSISSSYRAFEIRAWIRTGSNEEVLLRLNNDSGTNYAWNAAVRNTGSSGLSQSQLTGQSEIQVHRTAVPTTGFLLGTIRIAKPTATTDAGAFSVLGADDDAGWSAGNWSSATGLIDQITLLLDNSASFAAGTHAKLFGRLEP